MTLFGGLIQRNVKILNENIPNILFVSFILNVSLLGFKEESIQLLCRVGVYYIAYILNKLIKC